MLKNQLYSYLTDYLDYRVKKASGYYGQPKILNRDESKPIIVRSLTAANTPKDRVEFLSNNTYTQFKISFALDIKFVLIGYVDTSFGYSTVDKTFLHEVIEK